MPIVKCRICSKEFYTKYNWQAKGWGIYCSRKCQHESQKKGKVVHCFICSKEVYKALKQLEHSKSGKFFCNKSCQAVWRNTIINVEPNHPNWTNGESSYRDIMIRKTENMFCGRCNVTDRRVLVVHHIDKNRQNNNPNNLVWLCCNCHFLIHHHKHEMKLFMETLV